MGILSKRCPEIYLVLTNLVEFNLSKVVDCNLLEIHQYHILSMYAFLAVSPVFLEHLSPRWLLDVPCFIFDSSADKIFRCVSMSMNHVVLIFVRNESHRLRLTTHRNTTPWWHTKIVHCALLILIKELGLIYVEQKNRFNFQLVASTVL